MFLFLLLFLSLFIQYTVSTPCNVSTEFTCKDGSCIPQEWRCDNVADCSGRSDEAGCIYIHQCSPGMMMCRDGSCISENFKCDGEADCIDGKDEHFCEYEHSFRNIPKTPEPCLSPKYQCKTGGQCLMEDAVCDRIQDCPDGDDEANCRKDVPSNYSVSPCARGHIKCALSDICIPSYWVCDGSEDCFDGDDEKNCDGEMMESSKLCSVEEYKCEYGARCISLNQTCDGANNCRHGDDENKEYCQACKEKKCGYKCRITHTGTECYCPSGSKLEENGLTCGPIDYCQREEDGKQCQQFCNSTVTGYRCFCASGYTLQDNRHTCRTDIGGELLLALGSTIRTMPLVDPTHSSDGYDEWLNESVRYMDYSYQHKMLFASRPLSFSTDDADLLHPSQNPGIYACTFDGLFCRRIIEGLKIYHNHRDASQIQMYRGLALNPSSGKMYWLEYWYRQFKIKGSDMDGSNVETLIDNKLEEPQGLALDPITDNLYFADYSQACIEKFNLKTKERHIIVSRGVHYPIDLKYFDGYLYWADWGTDSLKMVDTTAQHTPATTVHSFRQDPMGIAVNHTSYQIMPAVNPCDKLAEICPWICVPVPGLEPGSLIGKCLCPMNYKESNETTCFPRAVSNSTLDGENSPFLQDYVNEVCSTGKACLNGGHCWELPQNTTVGHLNCSCPVPYIGERCELVDPKAKNEKETASWSGFWTFCAVLVLLATGFGVLYHKNERIRIITQETIGHLRDRNVRDWWPILNERAVEEEVPASEPRSFSNPFSSM